MSSENVVDPEERMKCLIATRNLKMAASAHAYVRGCTTRYYEWLEASNGTALPSGPAVWICGDCHVGNRARSPAPMVRLPSKFETWIRL